MNELQSIHCNLCSKSQEPFTSLIQHSLYVKHSHNICSTRQVDDILEQNLFTNFVRLEEYNYFDHDEELLRREYGQHEFGHKIEMLSEYFKFHRDNPTWNDQHIEGIMGKYYSRVKDVVYKIIKKVLKEEEGISLTTQRSESSFEGTEGTEDTKKSKFSTMLHDLEKSNETIKLMDMCMKMEEPLKRIRNENDFKGEFASCGGKFEAYLKKLKKRKDSHVENSEENRKGFEKLKANKKKSKKAHDIIGLRQIMFASNHSMKQKKYETIKSKVSNSKTTAADTISREEITKREKSRSIQLPTGRELCSYRNYESKHIANEQGRSKLKPLNEFNIASIIKKFEPKHIKDIYDPVEKQPKKAKVLKWLNKKSPQKLKSRSKSQQVIQTYNNLNKNPSKKELNPSFNPQRNASCKNLAKSSKFATIEVDHFQNQQKELLSFRQNEKKISRSSSTGKIRCCKSKQYETYNLEDKKERNKRAIDNILETKLMGMKKKPILI